MASGPRFLPRSLVPGPFWGEWEGVPPVSGPRSFSEGGRGEEYNYSCHWSCPRSFLGGMGGGTPVSGPRFFPEGGERGRVQLVLSLVLPDGGDGVPQSGPRTGVPPAPPPPSQNQDRIRGTPSPGQHMPRTGYAAGRTSLEVTQEDFLVVL